MRSFARLTLESRLSLRQAAMILLTCLTGSATYAQELAVVSVSPTRNGLDAGLQDAVVVEFDRPVDPTTFTSANFAVFGRWSGRVAGTFQFSNGNRTVSLVPDEPLSAGELVSVNLSKNLRAADSAPMRGAGYSYQYWTQSRATGTPQYVETATMTTGVNTRPYAGVATDLNNDGWLDLTVVNEDTADLRVYLNEADGTGAFEPYAQPTYGVANRASPVETQDFNNDGRADIAVANINNNSVSILLGLGDGRYSPQQKITVGSAPRGLAVLDVDGDADMDIVNTNFSSNNLSLLLNDGNGVFGAPTYFQGGVNGERSLTAGDMDNDGIADLIVGGFNDSTFRVLRGTGNGTFAQMPSTSAAGGQTWSLSAGDVNGDGNLDVVSVNGFSENGSVALGSGAGGLQAPTIYNTLVMGDGANSTPTGSSIGDLDGDGDLDWIASPYGNGGGDGDWLVLLNNGAGGFAFAREIQSQLAPAWSVLADTDNDGDLDLALIDEEADSMKLMESANRLGDMNYDGTTSLNDMAGFREALLRTGEYEQAFGPHSARQGDASGDGALTHADVAGFLALLPPGATFADFDANGAVDGADLDAWRLHFGGTSQQTAGDADLDDDADGQDFLAWQRQAFFAAATPASPAVSEPASLGAAFWGLAAAAIRRRRSLVG